MTTRLRFLLPRSLPFLTLSFVLGGCASLHHAQLDEIDASRGHLEPFEIRVSDIGVDVKEAGQLASALTNSRKPSQAAAVAEWFQFGPKTGDPVFDDKYADGVAQAILEHCPSGRVTGLVSLRESTKYYAVSGEYVTVKGFCVVD
jgi:hypothetical protein